MATGLLGRLFSQASFQARINKRDSVFSQKPSKPKLTRITLSDGDFLEFDVAQDISHVAPIKVTEYPVEKGSNISDHVVNQNWTFSITGIFANASLTLNEKERPYTEQDVFLKLVNQIAKKDVVVIKTPLNTFRNCIITNFSIPKNKSVGHSLTITIDFQQVRFVDTSTTIVNTNQPIDSSKTTGDTKDKTTPVKDKGDIAGTITDQSRLSGLIKNTASIFKSPDGVFTGGG